MSVVIRRVLYLTKSSVHALLLGFIQLVMGKTLFPACHFGAFELKTK